MMEHLRAMHEGGAILALGTDRSYGPTVHQELGLLIEAGIPPSDALKMATLNAAIYLGKENELGSIEVGKLGRYGDSLRQTPQLILVRHKTLSRSSKEGNKSTFPRWIFRSTLIDPGSGLVIAPWYR